MVEVQDAQGRTVPGAENELMFTIQGEGRLIGVDNGNPESHENYKANYRNAFNGLCLVILQSTAKAGPIRITASSLALHPGVLSLTAES